MDPIIATTESSQPEQATPFPVIREHVVATADTCGGKPRIAGSRIQVKHVAFLYERLRFTPEQIVSEFPHLTLADIHAALAYYHDHREAMNAEIKADREWYEDMRANAPSLVRDKLEQRNADAQNDSLSPR